MSAPAADIATELQTFRDQARMADRVLRRNVDGVTHEESLRQPERGGNCLNWVVGHLVWVYAGALELLGQDPVLDRGSLARYARGAPPLESPAEARNFGELMAAWVEEADRVDAGLAALPAETLGRPAPHSPSGNPDGRWWRRSSFIRPITPGRRVSSGGSSGSPAPLREVRWRRQPISRFRRRHGPVCYRR